MNDKQKLNENELANVGGGKFVNEFEGWYERNYDTLVDRARKKNARNKLSLLFLELKDDRYVAYSIQAVKQKLKEIGIECDDLV